MWIERGWGDKFLNITRGKCEQGFRRMAARNKPAGIRSLVYGMSKGKAGIESLSVSGWALSVGWWVERVLYTRLSMIAFLAASLRSLTESAW